MATILIVDDRAVNRQYLVALLGHCGHRTLEAADGAEALVLARTEHPSLIITDIVMPTMDGAEMVQALHADPALAATPVIFYSASYREKEGRVVGDECGVSIVLSKPADPQVMLKAVNEALGGRAGSAEVPAGVRPPGPDRGLVTDALRQRLSEQQQTSARLAVIIELGLDLTGDRDPGQMTRRFCKGARDIVSARFASVGLLSADGSVLAHFCIDGLTAEDAARLPSPFPLRGELAELVKDGKPRRQSGIVTPAYYGFPDAYPAVSSFMGVAVATMHRTYGWLSFCNKVGAPEFSNEDERLAVTLAAQLAVTYENAVLQAKAVHGEKALRMFRTLIDHTNDAIEVVDPHTARFLDVNERGCLDLGYTRAEFLALSVYDIDPLVDAATFATLMAKLHPAGSLTWNGVHRRKDGTTFPVEVNLKYVQLERDYLVTVVRDVTERKRLEDRIVNLGHQQTLVLDSAHEGMFGLDLQGRHTFVNPAAARMLGYEVAELIGGHSHSTWHHTKADGRPYPEEECPIYAAISDGKVHAMDCEVFWRKDGTSFPAEYESAPIRENGRLTGAVVTFRDISERRRTEEKMLAMQAQLRQQQKLEAIGTLAGGIAHEINNPINGIMNYAQLISDKAEASSPSKEYADEILKETQRVADIVRNLLTFARFDKQSHSPAHLADIVEATLSLVRAVIRHDHITLEVFAPTGLPKIKCRSQQIQQVLMNLLTNARDALNERYPGFDENKRIRLTVRPLTDEGGRWLRITVEDSGSGIPSEITGRIFDPFFTTKPKERGTGLGLSISLGIMKEHNGRLLMETEVGKGTRFHMDMPVDDASVM